MCTCTRWFQDRAVDEKAEYFPKRHPLRYWGLRCALVAALVLLFAQRGLAQVPPVMNDRECGILAEMVMSGRALDKHGVSGEQFAKIMADFYAPLLAGNAGGRVQIYLNAVARFVARPEAKKIEPHALWAGFRKVCLESGGNVGAIFGTES